MEDIFPAKARARSSPEELAEHQSHDPDAAGDQKSPRERSSNEPLSEGMLSPLAYRLVMRVPGLPGDLGPVPDLLDQNVLIGGGCQIHHSERPGAWGIEPAELVSRGTTHDLDRVFKGLPALQGPIQAQQMTSHRLNRLARWGAWMLNHIRIGEEPADGHGGQRSGTDFSIHLPAARGGAQIRMGRSIQLRQIWNQHLAPNAWNERSNWGH